MEEFKPLNDDELDALSSKERREYLKKKRAYENEKLVNETVNQSTESVPVVAPPPKKKSNVGRKSIAASEKKQQIMLTIEAASKTRLESVDEKNYKKLLARYIDKNIDDIVKAIEQL